MSDLNAKIIPLHSEVEGRVPTDVQLDVGELAYNITDRKIYTKNAAGEVVILGRGADEQGDVDGLPGGGFKPIQTPEIGATYSHLDDASGASDEGYARYATNFSTPKPFLINEVDSNGNSLRTQLQGLQAGDSFWWSFDGGFTTTEFVIDTIDEGSNGRWDLTPVDTPPNPPIEGGDTWSSSYDTPQEFGVDWQLFLSEPGGPVDVPLADGDMLRYDGEFWRPQQNTLENLDNVEGTAAGGNVLQYDGVDWQIRSLDFSIEDANDFDLRIDTGSGNPIAKATGDALVWDGSNWVPANVAQFLSISDLTDVNTVTVPPTDGQVLAWDQTQGYWKPANGGTGGGGSDLQGTTESGNTTDQGIFITKADSSAAIDLTNTGASTFRGLMSLNTTSRGEKLRLFQGAGGTVNIAVEGSSSSDVLEYNVEDSNGKHSFKVDGAELLALKALTLEAKQKVTSPVTVAEDPGNTLTTKRYVEDLIETATGGGLSGAGALTERADVTVSNSYLVGQTRDEVFIGLGEAGTFVQVTVSRPAWVRFYATAADRTSDSGRDFDVDPQPGSGVLLEVKTTQNDQVVKITPAAIYYNNDTLPDQALYAKITNDGDADTTIAVSVRAYTQTNTDTIDGGSFGSG